MTFADKALNGFLIGLMVVGGGLIIQEIPPIKDHQLKVLKEEALTYENSHAAGESSKIEEIHPLTFITFPSGKDPRNALNLVGGETVDIKIVDVPCDMENVPACVDPQTSYNEIQIAAGALNMGYRFWYDTMTHEYAHIIQINSWEELSTSESFKNMFNEDLEYHADCMAAARIDGYISGYKYVCSEKQIETAGKVWAGIIL